MRVGRSRGARYCWQPTSRPATDFHRLEAPELWDFTVELSGRRLAVAFNPSDRPQTLHIPCPDAAATARAAGDDPVGLEPRNGALGLRLRPVEVLLVTS